MLKIKSLNKTKISKDIIKEIYNRLTNYDIIKDSIGSQYVDTDSKNYKFIMFIVKNVFKEYNLIRENFSYEVSNDHNTDNDKVIKTKTYKLSMNNSYFDSILIISSRKFIVDYLDYETGEKLGYCYLKELDKEGLFDIKIKFDNIENLNKYKKILLSDKNTGVSISFVDHNRKENIKLNKEILDTIIDCASISF